MNENIRELLGQISEIEEEIERIINEHRDQVIYLYEDGKIKFKEGIEEAHKELKKNILRFLLDSKFRNILSAPFIYSMIIPFVIMDISISIYQSICFSLYRIKKSNVPLISSSIDIN